MKQYGIIGHPVAQSFSARYFTDKFAHEQIDARYCLYDLPCLNNQDQLPDLDGYNVTIPYKLQIMPLLDAIDPIAQRIGAVNVVQRTIQNGQPYTIGYNTDYLGFMQSIHPLLRKTDKQALVFGTGGAAKAVTYALTQLGLHPTLVSRHPQTADQLAYNELTPEIISTHTVLVNCTPVGMWPDSNACVPIPYEAITSAHLLFDCIYNPEETLFLQRGREHGARICNGYEMLINQAEEAWKIWEQRTNNR